MKFQLTSGLQQSLLYGASIGLMKGTSLLVLPFVAQHLTNQEFGRLEVISTLAIIGSILVGMGLEDTLFRFAGACEKQSQREKIASEIFSLTLIMTALAFLIGWNLAPQLTSIIPGNATVYELRLVLSVLAFEGAIAIPLGWMRMSNHALLFFFSTTGRALLQAILVVVFLHWQRGVSGILEAGLIAATLQMLLLAVYQLRNTGLHFSLITLKRSFIYSLPIVGSGLVAFVLNGLDRWILAEQVGLASVAQFAIAAKFSIATVLLLQPFSMWWTPRRFKVLNSYNGKQQVVTFIMLGSSLAIVVSTLLALLCPTLIEYLLPESYLKAGQYALAMIWIMLLKELVELFNIGCFHGKTTNTQFIINTIATVVGLTLMLLLTPIYEVWGLIFSLFIAQFIRLILFYNASQYFLNLNYHLTPLLILAATGITWVWLSTQPIFGFGLFALAILLVLATLSLCLVIMLFKLCPLPVVFLQKTSDS